MTAPHCILARFIPKELDIEEIKADGWNQHRILVVSPDDPRLGAIERHILEQIGDKLYRDRRQARG